MKLPLRLAFLSTATLVPLFACAGNEAERPPPHAAPRLAEPSASASASASAATAEDFSRAAAMGWMRPRIARDPRGRVESVRFAEVTRATHFETDAWRSRVTSLAATYGDAFGYGALGAPGRGYHVPEVASDEARLGLGVVTFPSAERCPGLEVGLVFANAHEGGDGLRVPKEWVVFCPREAFFPHASIADKVRTPGNFRAETLMARDSSSDPLVGWLGEQGYSALRVYERHAGTRRLVFENTPSTTDPLALARGVATKVAEVERLPPLDREKVVREREKAKRVVRVVFSATSNPLTARHIAPSVALDFSAPHGNGPQNVLEIRVDAEEEPEGPRPPRDDARTLPPSFATSPEVLYYCHTQGGGIPVDDSTLVDRRGDVYEFVGGPPSFAIEDIQRAMRRGKRYIGTLEPGDVGILAKAPSNMRRMKLVSEHVLADAASQECFYFRPGKTAGVLEPIPASASRAPGNVVVRTPELETVLWRLITLQKREAIR